MAAADAVGAAARGAAGVFDPFGSADWRAECSSWQPHPGVRPHALVMGADKRTGQRRKIIFVASTLLQANPSR